MKIIGLQPTATTRTEAKKRKSGVGESAFEAMLSAAEEAAEAGATEQARPVAATSPLTAMLALQEVDDHAVTRRKAVKQGRLSLDALDQLRQNLLMGTLSPGVISNLEDVIRQQREYELDPELKSLLDDIELRVAVELAKIEVAQNHLKDNKV